MLAFPRLLIARSRPRHADLDKIVAQTLSFLQIAALSSFSTARRRRSPTCCAASTIRGGRAMAVVGYWAIGAPIGIGLAFFTPLAGRGLWIGLAAGSPRFRCNCCGAGSAGSGGVFSAAVASPRG